MSKSSVRLKSCTEARTQALSLNIQIYSLSARGLPTGARPAAVLAAGRLPHAGICCWPAGEAPHLKRSIVQHEI